MLEKLGMQKDSESLNMLRETLDTLGQTLRGLHSGNCSLMGSYPSYKTMSHVFWKLLILLQLLQENAARVKRIDVVKLFSWSSVTKKRFSSRCWRSHRAEQSGSVSLGYWLVVKLVEVLHVSKDDVLLVDDARRNLLHTAGHLPQVCLGTSTQHRSRTVSKK